MFTHQNIHKYTCTSPNGKTHNQTDNILIDRKRYLSILDVQYFRGADCDTDLYLEVAKVRETSAISKQVEQKFHVVIFNLKKLSKLEVIKEYQIKISNSIFNITIDWDFWRNKDPVLPKDALVWFTDGSRANSGTGSGIFGFRPNRSFSFSLGKFATVFQN